MIVVTHTGTGLQIVARCLRSLGARAVVIEDRYDARSVRFDALVLLGGTDISPFFYGGDPRRASHPDRERDIIEWTLCRRAIAAEKPVLGICRGHQMLAVAHGGSLYQDIGTDTCTDHPHSYHRLVRIDRRLRPHLTGLKMVNSLHHQAVRLAPPGFDVLACAPDGIIECIYRPGYLGVQWHPELMLKDGWTSADSVFRWLVQGQLE